MGVGKKTTLVGVLQPDWPLNLHLFQCFTLAHVTAIMRTWIQAVKCVSVLLLWCPQQYLCGTSILEKSYFESLQVPKTQRLLNPFDCYTVKCNCAATCLPVSKQDGGEPQADRNRKTLIEGRDRNREISDRNKEVIHTDTHRRTLDQYWTECRVVFPELNSAWVRRKGHPPGESRAGQGSVEPLKRCFFLMCTWLEVGCLGHYGMGVWHSRYSLTPLGLHLISPPWFPAKARLQTKAS